MAKHIVLEAATKELDGLPYSADFLPIVDGDNMSTLMAHNVSRIVETTEDFGGLMVALSSDDFGLRHYYMQYVAPMIPEDMGGFIYTPEDNRSLLSNAMLAAKQILMSEYSEDDDELVILSSGLYWESGSMYPAHFIDMKHEYEDGYGFLLSSGAVMPEYKITGNLFVAGMWLNKVGAENLLEYYLADPSVKLPEFRNDSWFVTTNSCHQILGGKDYKKVINDRSRVPELG